MILEGLGLFVEDMGKMIRFYRDVMGFEIMEPENAVNVYLKKDGVLFMLYERKNFEKMSRRRYEYLKGFNGHYEIALKVESFAAVDEVFSQATSKGARPVMLPGDHALGAKNLLHCRPGGKSYRDRLLRR